MRTRISALTSQTRSPGFTMVEIALCLAIIGFALVAIIAVLPRGLSVQQENREETIIDKDAQVWMDAIRHGAEGFDDLTNYVIGITNHWTNYVATPTATNGTGIGGVVGYVPDPTTPYALTNGFRIIGLLTTPCYLPGPPPADLANETYQFQSNYVEAWVRAMSGSAADKFPQKNATILGGAFSYKMTVKIVPYLPSAPIPANNAAALAVQKNLEMNSHSIRLLFRWPLQPGNRLGNGRATFRLFAGGWFTNYPPQSPFYFLQPSTYMKAP